MYCVKNVHLI